MVTNARIHAAKYVDLIRDDIFSAVCSFLMDINTIIEANTAIMIHGIKKNKISLLCQQEEAMIQE